MAGDGMDRIKPKAKTPTDIQLTYDQHRILQTVPNLLKNATESAMGFRQRDG